MSAIWGCIDFEGKAPEAALSDVLRRPYEDCRIDRIETVAQGPALMGCGIQYIARHAERDPLPVYRAEDGLFFTADCIVDNSDELIAALDMPPETADGELMLGAWLRWKTELGEHVRGCFAFAAYDERERRLVVSADHVFNRSIYYARRGGRVYFSTLLQPLVRALWPSGPPELNDFWLTYFLADSTLDMLVNPADTPYKGIFKVVAGEYVQFTASETRPLRFWDPLSIKRKKYRGDDNHCEEFRAIMEACAGEALQTDGEVGILLSSGFDSASVAAFAAPELEKNGRPLNAYTIVPQEGFDGKGHPPYRILDETPGVRLICEMYPNIRPNFLSLPGLDAFSRPEYLLRLYETPFKSLSNVNWIEEFCRMAADEGCRVLLEGQMGNLTVSYGSIYTYLGTKLAGGHFIGAARAVNRYAKRLHLSRRRFFPDVARMLKPQWLSRLFVRDYLAESLVNRETAAGLGWGKKSSQLRYNIPVPHINSLDKESESIYNLKGLSTVGEIETKQGLRHGLVIRDITKDKRIFEFCLSSPMEYFVDSDTVERCLVRKCLKDRVPREILYDYFRKGLQGADWIERLRPRWDEVHAELTSGCRCPGLERYADSRRVAEALERFRTPPEVNEQFEFLRLIGVYNMGLFLRENS